MSENKKATFVAEVVIINIIYAALKKWKTKKSNILKASMKYKQHKMFGPAYRVPLAKFATLKFTTTKDL